MKSSIYLVLDVEFYFLTLVVRYLAFAGGRDIWLEKRRKSSNSYHPFNPPRTLSWIKASLKVFKYHQSSAGKLFHMNYFQNGFQLILIQFCESLSFVAGGVMVLPSWDNFSVHNIGIFKVFLHLLPYILDIFGPYEPCNVL